MYEYIYVYVYVCAFWCIVTLVYINLFFQVRPACSQIFNLLAVCLYQHLLLGIGKIPKPVVLNFFGTRDWFPGR